VRAGFGLGNTLETFNFDRLPRLDRTDIRDFATDRYIDEKFAILMVGQKGVGKSHIAQALGHCAARQGLDVLFVTQTDLIRKLHAVRATGFCEHKFQQFVRVPLLIVDDFALPRAPHDEDFHDLVAARYELAPTILTSNHDHRESGDAFRQPSSRRATLDRLRHGACCIVIESESFRHGVRFIAGGCNFVERDRRAERDVVAENYLDILTIRDRISEPQALPASLEVQQVQYVVSGISHCQE
jgi:DNA replication protein DnaC